MRKVCFSILIFLLFSSVVTAEYIKNPYTQKPDYYETMGDSTIDTSAFDQNLSSTDDTVQEALETLDELTVAAQNLQQVTDQGTSTTDVIETAGYNTTRTDAAQYSYWYEPTSAGNQYVGFTAPAAITTSIIWTLPAADAAGGITSNGSGALSIVDYVTSAEIDTIAELDTIVADANVLSAEEIDTIAELDTIVADANVLSGEEIDTIAELDAIVADANVLSEEEIDASSELAALMDDETGSGVLCYATNPTITTGITSADDFQLALTGGDATIEDDGNVSVTLKATTGASQAVTLALQRGTLTADANVDWVFAADTAGALTITGSYSSGSYIIGRFSAGGYFGPGTDATYYLGKNDDDTPFAWKGIVLKDTTNGKYYRIEVINGTITPTDLTD